MCHDTRHPTTAIISSYFLWFLFKRWTIILRLRHFHYNPIQIFRLYLVRRWFTWPHMCATYIHTIYGWHCVPVPMMPNDSTDIKKQQTTNERTRDGWADGRGNPKKHLKDTHYDGKIKMYIIKIHIYTNTCISILCLCLPAKTPSHSRLHAVALRWKFKRQSFSKITMYHTHYDMSAIALRSMNTIIFWWIWHCLTV